VAVWLSIRTVTQIDYSLGLFFTLEHIVVASAIELCYHSIFVDNISYWASIQDGPTIGFWMIDFNNHNNHNINK
jgi:hypothetical protein